MGRAMKANSKVKLIVFCLAQSRDGKYFFIVMVLQIAIGIEIVNYFFYNIEAFIYLIVGVNLGRIFIHMMKFSVRAKLENRSKDFEHILVAYSTHSGEGLWSYWKVSANQKYLYLINIPMTKIKILKIKCNFSIVKISLLFLCFKC